MARSAWAETSRGFYSGASLLGLLVVALCLPVFGDGGWVVAGVLLLIAQAIASAIVGGGRVPLAKAVRAVRIVAALGLGAAAGAFLSDLANWPLAAWLATGQLTGAFGAELLARGWLVLRDSVPPHWRRREWSLSAWGLVLRREMPGGFWNSVWTLEPTDGGEAPTRVPEDTFPAAVWTLPTDEGRRVHVVVRPRWVDPEPSIQIGGQEVGEPRLARWEWFLGGGWVLPAAGVLLLTLHVEGAVTLAVFGLGCVGVYSEWRRALHPRPGWLLAAAVGVNLLWLFNFGVAMVRGLEAWQG